MNLFPALKKHVIFTLLSCSSFVSAELPITGILGGEDMNTVPSSQYASAVSPINIVSPVALGMGAINSVALNDLGIGLIGGQGTSDNQFYAAFISSEKGIEPLSLPSNSPSSIHSVAINQSNLGLIGGRLVNSGYASFVSQTAVNPITLNLTPSGLIASVALNNANLGLIGGGYTPFSGAAYAAFVSPSESSAQELSLGEPHGFIESVAINNSGLGLIGGYKRPFLFTKPYAALVRENLVMPIVLEEPVGEIHNVAINEAGQGLLGGAKLGTGYALFVSSDALAQEIAGLPTDVVEIESVAINHSGRGLIGGRGANYAYAAFVFPDAPLQQLLGIDTKIINSVALNDFNQGLLGGENYLLGLPYAALVSPSGKVTELNLGFSEGAINSAAINMFFLSQIPTERLKGNNLRFANYINANAPQNAFYFVPALLDGSLSQAFQTAAPTRNLISFNTVLQNTFYLTTNLSTHLRDQRFIQQKPSTKPTNITQNEELLTSLNLPSKSKQKSCAQPYTLSVEAIGAIAYQDGQNQTVGFSPATGGATLAFDGRLTEQLTVGGGATYLYTHTHEKQSAGSCHINQEDLFLYASWTQTSFYLDGALWGGLFQTNQTRKIQMTGFAFTANSKPHGWQLVPHLELGWVKAVCHTERYAITCNLLGMIDWANGWQHTYKETGNSPFNIEQTSQHGSLLRTEAGLRWTETLFYSDWNLIFQEKASFINIESFHAGKLNGFLVGSPGAFTLETLTSAQNLGAVQFLMTWSPKKSWRPTGTLFYQGEFGTNYQSHQISLEFAFNF